MRELTSITSDSGAPVPWASEESTSCDAMPAFRTQSAMTSSSAMPFGAPRLAPLPLVLMLTPARTPTTGCLSSRTLLPSTTSASGFNAKDATPSPRTKPQAEASNVRHLPLRDSQPMPQCCGHQAGAIMSCAPMPRPKSEMTPRPFRCTDSEAMKTAVMLEDWSVSMAMLGPFMPRTKESRFAATQPAPPVGPFMPSPDFSAKPYSPKAWPT
mmetsp:Transcript_70710/g.207067  ORF Transcript_70710/g.207067 Transcript_70710/m.207067 type:complete len:212 (+) Transcript_70710:1436-2071(+)